jgi:hypothetical protein
MILLEPAGWTKVLQNFIEENNRKNGGSKVKQEGEFKLSELKASDVLPLWSGFAPTASRELPFAIAKFLVFDVLSHFFTGLLNSQTQEGALPIQVGVGPVGLGISAVAGALAGIAGAIVSHPGKCLLFISNCIQSAVLIH